MHYHSLSRCIWPPGTIGSFRYNITQSALTLDTLCACDVTTDLILTEPISALDELHKCTQHFSLTLNAQILNISTPSKYPQLNLVPLYLTPLPSSLTSLVVLHHMLCSKTGSVLDLLVTDILDTSLRHFHLA